MKSEVWQRFGEGLIVYGSGIVLVRYLEIQILTDGQSWVHGAFLRHEAQDMTDWLQSLIHRDLDAVYCDRATAGSLIETLFSCA